MAAKRMIGRLGGALALSLCLACTGPAAQTAVASGEQAARPPIMIERQGSFHAGGKVLRSPEGETLSCDHGYVEYQIPVDARRTGLFMWHSSSAHVWQQRWDGGEGFRDIFLRRGFPVYLWDGPRVGRANWGCEPYTFTPFVGQDQRNYLSWRLGPAEGEWFPGVQFPRDDPAALEQAMRARYDEFDTEPNVHLQAEAAARAIDRIGPVVLVTNSAGGLRGLLAATKTDNIKAIVAYETPALVFPEGEGPQKPTGAIDSIHVPPEDFKKLTRIPIQLVWGDNTEGTFWTAGTELSRQFVEIMTAHGGQAEVLMLPSVGLTGNTHIPFADLNNVQVADQLSLFLEKHGLDQR